MACLFQISTIKKQITFPLPPRIYAKDQNTIAGTKEISGEISHCFQNCSIISPTLQGSSYERSAIPTQS